MKTDETKQIEQALMQMCRDKRWYGASEITIGFYRNGHGNEICDFMLMDGNGDIRCYEIKISVSDLRSGNKLSWHGKYNYLVIGKSLYEKIDTWINNIPDGIGIIVYIGNGFLKNVRRSKTKIVSNDDEMMLKESIIRSMFYKMDKAIATADGTAIEKVKSAAAEWKRKYDNEIKKQQDIQRDYREVMRAVRRYKHETGIDVMEREENNNNTGK